MIGDLLQVMAGTPRLDGALCRGRHEWFDLPDRRAPRQEARRHINRAKQLCAACPALTPCAQWLNQLAPRHRPPGIVAGQTTTRRTKRKPA